MLRKIKAGLLTIRDNYRIAKNSRFNKLSEKIHVFGILNTLTLKSNLKRFKAKGEASHKIFDFKITAFDHYTLLFLFKEVFLENEYNFKSDTLSPKIIDCGANIGMSVIFFKMLYPNSIITAFEPNPFAYSLLRKNIEQNDLHGVETFNLALSSEKGEVDFFIGNDKGTLLGSIYQERGGENTLTIATTKLSDHLDGKQVDLIKMDVEGAEIEILKDLVQSGTIDNSIKYIIEYHHKMSSRKSNFSSFLTPFEKLGFDYNIRTTFGKLGGFQDILIYFYKQ